VFDRAAERLVCAENRQVGGPVVREPAQPCFQRPNFHPRGARPYTVVKSDAPVDRTIRMGRGPNALVAQDGQNAALRTGSRVLRPALRPTSPVLPRRELLSRPRLLDPLAGRFERRLTVLSAGPGFGKTTLLAQSVEANARSPRGLDLWLGCGPGDGTARRLAHALGQLVGLGSNTASSAEAICDAVWRRAPQQVALILDDVHYIESESPGAALLSRLLESLPANAHLVMATRSELPVPTARLRARGELLEIGESLLGFDSSERGAFAELRGVPDSSLGTDGGWPALLELRAEVGPVAADEFLWEEVLSRLDEPSRRALGCLVELEWVDDELVRELTQLSTSAAELLRDLPLTSFDRSGAARIHPLWRTALRRLKSSRWPDSAARAARALLERGEYLRALELSCELNDDVALAALVERLSLSGWREASREVLEAVVERLPERMLESPSGELLRAMALASGQPARARRLFESAGKRFAEKGELEGQRRALSGQIQVAYWEGDVDAILAATERAESLAGGVSSGETAPLLWGRAYAALAQRRPEEALDFVARARSEPGGELRGQPIATLAYLDLGEPEQALEEIERELPHAVPRLRGTLLACRQEARWMLGLIDAREVDRGAERMSNRLMGFVQNAALNHAANVHQNAALGRADKAREQLERAREYARRAVGPRIEIVLALAAAALDTLGEEEESAAATLRQAVLRVPLGQRPYRGYLRGIALLYLHLPEQRDAIDALELGPCYDRARQAARALVALRESGDPAPAAALSWSQADKFRLLLVPPLVVELAVAALARGVEEARGVIEETAGARLALRRIARSASGSVGARAKELLAVVPSPPGSVLEIGVLGPLVLRRDGEPVEHPSWRRERVRSLLQYLVVHPDCSREMAGVALWPDADDASLANNLRVNLNHLQRVLEPERHSGESPWFLKQDGDRLRLRGGEWLRIDAVEFERLCEEGDRAERRGAPAVALERYRAAVALYRGDYLDDALDPAWGEFDRTRLRASFVRSAVRAGELLLGRGESEGALELGIAAARAEDLSEPAHRLQALAFRALQDRAAARRCLLTCLRLLEDAGLEPEPQTQALGRELGIG